MPLLILLLPFRCGAVNSLKWLKIMQRIVYLFTTPTDCHSRQFIDLWERTFLLVVEMPTSLSLLRFGTTKWRITTSTQTRAVVLVDTTPR